MSLDIAAGRPIELPTEHTTPTDPGETAAQKATDIAEDGEVDAPRAPSHTGADFDLDLPARSRGTAAAFGLLALLAVVLAVFATPLPVTITAGAIAGMAGITVVRHLAM